MQTRLYAKVEPDGEIVATSKDKKTWTGYLASDDAEIKELVFREDMENQSFSKQVSEKGGGKK